MQTELHRFLSRFVATVVLAVVPVIFTAFVSVPMSLGRHPGEFAQADVPPRHMT